MPEIKYMKIYENLRAKLDSGFYQEMLPSENCLAQEYGTSRNTIRRALAELAKQGLTISIPGKGVAIVRPSHPLGVHFGEIESFKKFTERTHEELRTKVVSFSEIVITEDTKPLMPFEIGDSLYHIVRLRLLKDDPIAVDSSYFLKEIVPDLSPEIGQHSIYEYLENSLNIRVSISKRMITVERISANMRKLLKCTGFDSVLLIRHTAYTQLGKLFEYTESHHHPDKYVFTDVICNQ